LWNRSALSLDNRSFTAGAALTAAAEGGKLGRSLLSRLLSTHRIGMSIYEGFEPIDIF
jgi:hypothetical protein